GLADTGIEDRPERVSGREIGAAVAVEGRDLEINRSGALLQGDDREIVDLALGLVEIGRGEIADTVDSEPETRCQVRDVGDLELGARCAKDGAQSCIRVDYAGDIGEDARLVAEIVNRVFAARRVLDPDIV